MNVKHLHINRVAFGFLFFSFFIFSLGVQDYSSSEVQKVIEALEKMEAEQSRGDKNSLEKIIITESEANSYIAFRIEREGLEILKEIRLKFLKENKIEGKIFVDLRGHKIPKFLRPQMTLYFGGRLEIEDGKARFDMKDLFLEDQRVQPKALDFVLYVQAKMKERPAHSINDWYELPYGIKSIETLRGEVIFYY